MNDQSADSPLCPPDPADWIARRQQVRATEWALHHEVLAAARTALQSFQDNSHKTTVAEITKLIELASRLGRLASGMEINQPLPPAPTVRIEVAAALKQIYGQPLELLAAQITPPALPPPPCPPEPPPSAS